MQLPLFTPESTWRPPELSTLPSWAGARRVAIDSETNDPHLRELGIGVRRDGYMVGVSFAIEDGPRHYLPFGHQGGDNLPREAVMGYLREQGQNFRGELVGANVSYDLDYLLEAGIEFPHVEFCRDVQIADPLIWELHQSYTLDAIAKRHGLPGKDEGLLREAAAAFGVDPKRGLWRLPARFVGAYAEGDVEQPLLTIRRQERLIDDGDLWDIYNLESQVLPVLVRMRRRGVRIDLKKLEEIETWSLTQEASALSEVKKLTGVSIAVGDVWKSEIMAPALEYIGIKLPRTSKGQPSVSQEVFASYDHPVTTSLAWARKVNKLRTTFAQSIRRYIVGDRIHTTFNQIARETEGGDQKGARYGRLSSTDPNLQQQPSRDEFAKMWRSIYLPERDALWACNDYCFSDDTEVLTNRGFVLFPELREDDLVAQVHPDTGAVDYALPVERQRVWFDGQLIHIQGKRTTDLLVTPNHNCLVYQGGRPAFVRADGYERQALRSWQLAAGTLGGGEDVPLEDIVTSVACQADGSLRRGSYRIWVKKERKVERCRAVVLYTNSYTCQKKGSQTAFIVPEHCAPLLDGKRFNRDRLVCMSLASRRLFLKELKFWDGSKNSYCTTDRHNAEVVQEIATLSGMRARMFAWDAGSGRKAAYTVVLSDRMIVHAGKYAFSQVSYSGHVYCVTMPRSTVIVRRHGRVSVTGQSQQEPRWTTHFAAVMDLEGARAAAQAYHDDPELDNHQFMADLTGLPRKFAKSVYLGLCYGEGGAKLCRDLGLPSRWALAYSEPQEVGGYRRRRQIRYFSSQSEAYDARAELGLGHVFEAAGEEGQKILDTFDGRAPFIRQLANAAKERASQRGVVRTAGGRMLHFPQRNDGSYDWVHKALNRIIQGTSADQMKKALVEIDKMGFWLMLQVHDEENSSVSSRREAEQQAEIMRDVMPALVPFKVDIEIGPSWGEAA